MQVGPEGIARDQKAALDQLARAFEWAILVHDRDDTVVTLAQRTAIAGEREWSSWRERVTRIELVSQAWKASALPLSYTRWRVPKTLLVAVYRQPPGGGSPVITQHSTFHCGLNIVEISLNV